MTEQTNLKETALNFEPEGLIDDETGSPVEEGKETKPTETTPKAFKLKYNGEEVEKTLEEVITLSQKGMNYDKVESKLKSLETAEERQLLSEMAKDAGFKDITSYVKNLKETTYKEKLDKKINDYIEQGLPEEHAKRLAEVDLASKPKEVDPIQKSFEELFQEFPDETKDFKELSDFPQEVQDMIGQGKSASVAYSKYLIKAAKEAQRTAAQNEDNAKRDTGSLSTSVGEKEDSFLKEFLGK